MKLKLEFHSIGWWYWVVSWLLIVSGLLGWEKGFVWVTVLSGWQILHYAVLEKSLGTLPVQVRIGFFLLALAGLKFHFLYWLPAVGLLARTTVDYCFLARVMSLIPWNLTEPFSLKLLKKRIFSPPTNGSILNCKSE